jgi:hypothetical protein
MPNEAKNESHSSLRSSKSGKKKKVSFNRSSSKEKTADKPRWLLLKLLRGDSTKGGSKKIFDEKNEENLVEHNPVIKLLDARSTQRVSFMLDTLQENPAGTPIADQTHDQDTATSNNKLSRFNVKNFMGRNLFNKDKSDILEELNNPDMQKANRHSSVLWKSAVEGDNSNFVHTLQLQGSELVAFMVNPKTLQAEVVKLLIKGRRTQHKYYQYKYSVKCHLKALELLKK